MARVKAPVDLHPRFSEAVKQLYPDIETRGLLHNHGEARDEVGSLIEEQSGMWIEWPLDGVAIPTNAECDAALASVDLRIVQASRRSAFAEEADPLFFKVQRGEAALADWQAKISEIRARFPYLLP
jgi:hypothetical protein